MEKIKTDVKVMIVSTSLTFAHTDVFAGYAHAFRDLGISFETMPIHLLQHHVSPDVSWSMCHSRILSKAAGITHVLFIAGAEVPNSILESLWHVKSCIMATEDPHAFDKNHSKLRYLTHYFSNEKSIIKQGLKGTHYMPVAADSQECYYIPREHLHENYLTDILFLGCPYPNRQKTMIDIIPFVKKHKLKFKILGHAGFMADSNPLWEFTPNANTVPHSETVKFYNGAKVVLNMERDIEWDAITNRENENKWNTIFHFAGTSLNPRAYETAKCGAFQMIDNKRKEVSEVFGKDGEQVSIFEDSKDLKNRLEYFLLDEKGNKKRREMSMKSMKNVEENHTYYNRVKDILPILEKDLT